MGSGKPNSGQGCYRYLSAATRIVFLRLREGWEDAIRCSVPRFVYYKAKQVGPVLLPWTQMWYCISTFSVVDEFTIDFTSSSNHLAHNLIPMFVLMLRWLNEDKSVMGKTRDPQPGKKHLWHIFLMNVHPLVASCFVMSAAAGSGQPHRLAAPAKIRNVWGL